MAKEEKKMANEKKVTLKVTRTSMAKATGSIAKEKSLDGDEHVVTRAFPLPDVDGLAENDWEGFAQRCAAWADLIRQMKSGATLELQNVAGEPIGTIKAGNGVTGKNNWDEKGIIDVIGDNAPSPAFLVEMFSRGARINVCNVPLRQRAAELFGKPGETTAAAPRAAAIGSADDF